MVVRKTPYYGAVDKKLLDTAEMCGEPKKVIRLGIIFENRIRQDAIDTMSNYFRMNLKLFANTHRHFNQYVIVKYKDIDKKNVKVIKVYEKETNELIRKLDTLLLLL
jgi:hypothetical protein